MPETDRLHGLLEAGIALSSELSLDALLQKLVETAAALTGARYAALGVVNRDRSGLERFVTTGIDEATAEAIGHLPGGRGILGVLIREARPLRLRDLHEHPDSTGFPANHPPMTTFLGVPIVLRGVAYGNLYLTEKQGGEFTQDDEDLTKLLAAQAAVAIENARLFESATRWSRQLESLTDVGNALATEIDLTRLLELIAAHFRDLVGAGTVAIMLPQPDGTLRAVAAHGDRAAEIRGVTLQPSSKSARVLDRRRPEHITSVVDDTEVDREAARRMGGVAALFVPLVSGDRGLGILAAHSDEPFADDEVRVAELFAARAAVAVELSQRISREALRRTVEAQELERRRLARELHDELGQVLTSILLGLRAAESSKDPQAARAAIGELRELVHTTLQDVRRLAVELRPKALDDFGLVPALQRLSQTFAEQSGLRIDFEARLEERLPPEVETTLYRIAQEALTNVVKHAQAERVSILLVRRGSSIKLVVEDDGRGLPRTEASGDGFGFGLTSMRERLALVNGALELESAEGAGTTIRVEVPLA